MAKEEAKNSTSNIAPPSDAEIRLDAKDQPIYDDDMNQRKLQNDPLQDESQVRANEADKLPKVDRIDEEQVFDNIRNCDLDPRGYRGVVLKNKLKVILISDPETVRSAACLNVHVGSSSDPDELKGLAHLLEHMLFLGTEKYPNKDDYSSFVHKHSGSHNASTHPYYTDYHFSIDPTYLEDALDRFAQFFISPLFDLDSMDKELNIIQSEFERCLDNNDGIKSHIVDRETCDQTHEYHKFGCGNRRTLKDEPESKGINVGERLVQFYSDNYSSNVMTLCVLGKQSLDELYEMVCKRLPFNEIKNKNVESKKSNRSPFLQEHLQKEIRIVPNGDFKSLDIDFRTNYDFNDNYLFTCKSYVSRLIHYAGEGSLISELKKTGLITCLSSSGNQIGVSLTKRGFEQVDEVIKTVIQYLNLIRAEGIQKRFLDESNGLKVIGFETKETHRDENPLCYVTTIAYEMRRYSIEDVVNHSLFLIEFKPEKLEQFIADLKPENMRITIMAHQFKGQTDRKEKYYSIDYSIQDISEDRLNSWKTAGLNANLQLPKPNEFIPTNLTLVERDEEQNEHPVLIKQDEFSNVWYLQDNVYKVPKSFFYIQIINPYFHHPDDPKHALCKAIYVLLIQDAFREYSNQACTAGLHCSISSSSIGLCIKATGYSERLHLILGKLIDKLIEIEFDRKRFNEFKEQFRRSLTDRKKRSLYSLLVNNEITLLTNDQFRDEDLLDALRDEVTFEEIENLGKSLFSKIAFDIFIHGNVTKKDVDLVEQLTKNRLIDHYKPIPLARRCIPSRKRTAKLEDNSFYIHCEENVHHQNNALLNYYQGDLINPISYTKNVLLVDLLNEKAFNQLRTEKQLGYFVDLFASNIQNVHGMALFIQSQFDPQHLDNCVELFIDWCNDYLNNKLTDEEFNAHKNSLRLLRAEPVKFLSCRSSSYWHQISSNECEFDQRKIDLEALDKISKQDIIDLFNTHLVENKRKLSLRILGKKTKSKEANSIKGLNDALLDETKSNENESDNKVIKNLVGDLIDGVVSNETYELPKNAKLIENVFEFNKSLFLYPHPKSKYAVY